MNRFVRVAAIAALLSTSASALAQDKARPPDGISFSAMAAWGTSSRNVWIGSDGKVTISTYQQQRPPEPCPPPVGEAGTCASASKGRTTISFSIGAAGFKDIRAILAPLEKKAANPGKQCRIYDAGNASVGWRLGGKELGYELGFACDQRQNQWADSLADAAEKKLTELQYKATDLTQVSE